MTEGMLTRLETAKALGVAPAHVDRLVKIKELTPVIIGGNSYFLVVDVLEFKNFQDAQRREFNERVKNSAAIRMAAMDELRKELDGR